MVSHRFLAWRGRTFTFSSVVQDVAAMAWRYALLLEPLLRSLALSAAFPAEKRRVRASDAQHLANEIWHPAELGPRWDSMVCIGCCQVAHVNGELDNANVSSTC
eukprot:gnl/MRDRNA2_/MRDRNA2_84394_c0_seq1.p1 gnl/MRDRNA2_/MRDRNA2_84394_c0~~gnl/MRDRNA2_/MRDRNA2_84394_c0_seq1.p1  ORF type:complete len:104 (-),score=11.37 gnl/MRDRNA2_/MRDRNA2_84394_c0_seq1:53-364(-)